jgi:hypothetical protein
MRHLTQFGVVFPDAYLNSMEAGSAVVVQNRRCVHSQACPTHMKTKPYTYTSSTLKLLVLAAACGASSVWADEPNPYYIGASETVKSDSNIRRAAEGKEVSDVISSTGVRAGLDQPLGRQRLRASLAANANRYRSNSELNNTDYDFGTSLDWETIERLSGVLSVNSRQALYQDTSLTSVGRNMLRTDSAAFQARLGVVTEFSFDLGASARRQRYSNDLYKGANLREHTIDGGIRYQPTPDWSVRFGLRRTDGTYADAIPSDDVARNDVELTSFLRLTGASTLDARLSHTAEKHTAANKNNTNGFTGALSWNWVITGKSSVGLTYSRDTNVGSRNDPNLPTSLTGSADSVLSNILSLRSTWQPTSKIRLNANLAYSKRRLDGGTLVGDVTDKTQSLSLGVSYAVLRNLDLGCGVLWEERKADQLIAQSYSYTDKTFNCYGQVFLR